MSLTSVCVGNGSVARLSENTQEGIEALSRLSSSVSLVPSVAIAQPLKDSSTMKFQSVVSTITVAAILTPPPLLAQTVQERIDLGVAQRIREEGLERSQVADLARYLTDVIGPRLTGSSGMRRANEWTAEQFRNWGLTNVTIEPWGEFGRGWERVEFHGRIMTPFERQHRRHGARARRHG
jgi:hypothetical protein